jgi:hypothetical protein
MATRCRPSTPIDRVEVPRAADAPPTTPCRTLGRRHLGVNQAESRARPLARRRFRTARPARELMRLRKPWVFLRLRLLGWYVRFTGRSLLGLSRSPLRAALSAPRFHGSGMIPGNDGNGGTRVFPQVGTELWRTLGCRSYAGLSWATFVVEVLSRNGFCRMHPSNVVHRPPELFLSR